MHDGRNIGNIAVVGPIIYGKSGFLIDHHQDVDLFKIVAVFVVSVLRLGKMTGIGAYRSGIQRVIDVAAADVFVFYFADFGVKTFKKTINLLGADALKQLGALTRTERYLPRQTVVFGKGAVTFYRRGMK